MLVDRRDELSKSRVHAANRLHRLLAELVPGQGKKDITTGQAKTILASGEIVRHRLSRAGNRRMNHMIHFAAATQIRLDTPGRAYYRRKIAAVKTRAEAMRCLKRRISDALYRQLRSDAATTNEAGPGGHSGAALQSSAAGLHPHTGTSDQPLPGPAPRTLPAPTTTRKATKPKALQPAP